MARLFIAGDFVPLYRNEKKVENGDMGIFVDILPEMQVADLAIVNLEAPVTASEVRAKKSGPNLKASDKCLDMLKRANVGLVTTANNHVKDYGSQGVMDTLAALEKVGIANVGSGANLQEARRAHICVVKGVKVGILNFAENEFCAAHDDSAGANPINPITNFYDIQALRSQVDFLLVTVHGGREHYQLPTPKTRERYRFYADCGADMVVGHHTHCFSGSEIWNGKPIFYSLGNFIFDYKPKYRQGLWVQGYALSVEISKDKQPEIRILPYWQGRAENPTLTLLSGADKEEFEHRYAELCTTIADDGLFKAAWEEYIDNSTRRYQAYVHIANPYLHEAVARGLIPHLPYDKKLELRTLNMLRCEAHNEILTAVLSRQNDNV